MFAVAFHSLSQDCINTVNLEYIPCLIIGVDSVAHSKIDNDVRAYAIAMQQELKFKLVEETSASNLTLQLMYKLRHKGEIHQETVMEWIVRNKQNPEMELRSSTYMFATPENYWKEGKDAISHTGYDFLMFLQKSQLLSSVFPSQKNIYTHRANPDKVIVLHSAIDTNNQVYSESDCIQKFISDEVKDMVNNQKSNFSVYRAEKVPNNIPEARKVHILCNIKQENEEILIEFYTEDLSFVTQVFLNKEMFMKRDYSPFLIKDIKMAGWKLAKFMQKMYE